MVNQSLGLKTEDQRTKEKAKNNPLPDIIIATVASNVSSEELAAAADEFRKIKNVDLVAYDDSWQRYLNALYTALSVVLGILGTVVFPVGAARDLCIRAPHNQRATRRNTCIAPIRRNFQLYSPSVLMARFPLTLMLAAVLSLGVTATGVSLLAKPIADFAGLYGVTVILRMPAIDWCLLYVASAALFEAYVVGSFAAKDAITRVLRHQP